MIFSGPNIGSAFHDIAYYPHTGNICSNIAEKKEITWDDAVESAAHGFCGTMLLTNNYGEYNLTPIYDLRKGASDWLFPIQLSDGLSMYKITHDERYLQSARQAADSIDQKMLNDKNILRMYSRRNGSSDQQPTSLNFYLLPAVAELAIYDTSYSPLARRIAEGIIAHGIDEDDIPCTAIFPNGTIADSTCKLPSNGGSLCMTVIGLLRTYEATGDPLFLNKSRDILISIWNKKRTRFDLVPTEFDSKTLKTIKPDTQMYATGELLKAFEYYYYLTHDPDIKEIIARYSAAASDAYWRRNGQGLGYFVYRVDVDTGRPSNYLLEANWHKLDIGLLYAGEITGKDFKKKVYESMNTYWLGKGLVYVNNLFRHGTNPGGTPAANCQSLLYASLRTSIYVMLRMLNDGDLQLSDQQWNDKVWDHVDALRSAHWHEYGYHSDVDVETLKPDARYYGLRVGSACGEFASLVTLIFRTSPNVEMVWEAFPKGDYVREPFSASYGDDDPGFMRGVFMDYAHREVAFKEVISNGRGWLNCSQEIEGVWKDGLPYPDWKGKIINLTDGKHEYAIVFRGGSYISPKYPGNRVNNGSRSSSWQLMPRADSFSLENKVTIYEWTFDAELLRIGLSHLQHRFCTIHFGYIMAFHPHQKREEAWTGAYIEHIERLSIS